jgi:hypothetical protein
MFCNIMLDNMHQFAAVWLQRNRAPANTQTTAVAVVCLFPCRRNGQRLEACAETWTGHREAMELGERTHISSSIQQQVGRKCSGASSRDDNTGISLDRAAGRSCGVERELVGRKLVGRKLVG